MHRKAKPRIVAICAAALLGVLGGCAAKSGGSGEAEPAAPATGARGGMCGGIAGFSCEADGDYCAFEPGQCVEIADAAGVCKLRPKICTQEYRPVCGCDGETYSNACRAATNGVSVAYEGECPPAKDEN